MADKHGWTRIEGRMAWARPFGLDYLLLYRRGKWCASHGGRIEAASTPGGAIRKVASQSEPLPVGLSDDGTYTEPAVDVARRMQEPRTREAIALDPQPGETVTDDSGREWRRSEGRIHAWADSGGCIYGPECLSGRVFDWPPDCGGVRVATIPDTLRGLDGLNAASAVLDRRWRDVPDGVDVAASWRKSEPRTPAPDAEDSKPDDPHPDLDLHPADEGRPEWSQRWPERGGRVWLVLEGDDYEPQHILGVFSTISGADQMARARMADTPTDYAGRSWQLAELGGDEVMGWRLGCRSVSIEEHQVVSR